MTKDELLNTLQPHLIELQAGAYQDGLNHALNLLEKLIAEQNAKSLHLTLEDYKSMLELYIDECNKKKSIYLGIMDKKNDK